MARTRKNASTLTIAALMNAPAEAIAAVMPQLTTDAIEGVVAEENIPDDEIDTSGIPMGGEGPFTDPATEPMLQPIPFSDELIPGEPTPIDPATGELVGFQTTTVVLPEETLTETEVQVLEAAAETTETVQESEAILTFDQAVEQVTPEAVETMVFATAAAMDTRADFEDEKDDTNVNIQKTLKKARNQLVSKRAATIMVLAKVDVGFINREVHGGARYNVYALGKLADVVYGVSGGLLSNKINVAILKSLISFRNAKVPFTGETARAAASDKVRLTEISHRKLLFSHDVAASTAPTQASSTMAALATLGLVKVSGTSRAPIYDLVDGPVLQKIEAQLFPVAVAA